MLKRPLSGAGVSWQRLLSILCAVIVCLLFLYRLGSMPSGLSPAEHSYITSTRTLNQVYTSPDNAPHKLAVLGAGHLFGSHTTDIRLVSALFGLLFAACFYVLCRNWFGRTVALMSLAVFVISPFFLITSRQLTPEVMRFMPLLLMTIYYWYNRNKKNDLGWILLLLVAALTLYIPGLFWWLAAAVVICRKQLLYIAGRISQAAAAAGLLVFGLAIIPIILAFVRDWHFVYRYLLIPARLPQPLDFLKHLGWMVLSLIIRTPYHDQLALARMPMLSIIQLVLLLFGFYALFSAAKKKAWWLAATIVFSVLLAALNNDVRLLLFGLPALGIFMAAGIRYLYIEWRGVFPKNPLPKALAIILLSAMVAIQAVYGLTYSLVAWPAAKDTKSTYVLK